MSDELIITIPSLMANSEICLECTPTKLASPISLSSSAHSMLPGAHLSASAQKGFSEQASALQMSHSSMPRLATHAEHHTRPHRRMQTLAGRPACRGQQGSPNSRLTSACLNVPTSFLTAANVAAAVAAFGLTPAPVSSELTSEDETGLREVDDVEEAKVSVFVGLSTIGERGELSRELSTSSSRVWCAVGTLGNEIEAGEIGLGLSDLGLCT